MDTTIQVSSYEDLSTYMPAEIIKKTNTKSIAFAIAYLLLGTGAFLLSHYVGKTIDIVGSLSLIVGIGLVLGAVYLLVWRSTSLVYQPTNSPILKKEYYFDSKYMQSLKSILKDGNSDKINHIETLSGANVKVLMLYSKDRQFFMAQMYKYEPFTYDPCDNICSFSGTKAQSLVASFLSLKK